MPKNNRFVRQYNYQLSNFRTENWVEKLIIEMKYIVHLRKLDLKLHCYSRVCVIIAIHT